MAFMHRYALLLAVPSGTVSLGQKEIFFDIEEDKISQLI